MSVKSILAELSLYNFAQVIELLGIHDQLLSVDIEPFMDKYYVE